MRTEDPEAEYKKRQPDLLRLRDKILSVNCCYYCSDEDTRDLVGGLARYGAAAVPVLVEALSLPFPSPLIAASRILGQLGWSARAAIPSLTHLLDYKNQFEPHSVGSVVESASKALKRIQAFKGAHAGGHSDNLFC